MRLGVERDTELAQLLDRFPDRGPGDGEIRGQRLARTEVPVVEPLEHALRQWSFRVHERPRPNNHSLRARGSVPARMRATLPR